jgi:hypothetical protein
VVLALLLSVLLAPAGRATALAAPPGAPLDAGSIGALALDNAGNGWAWAAPRPQTFATSFLIAIVGETATVAADSTSNPTLLPPGLRLARMAITADGADGWAIGAVVGAGETETPLLWRLDKGAWRVARTSFPAGLHLIDLALSADGQNGWITAFDNQAFAARLLWLRNGSWEFVAEPPEGELNLVALSPDGHSGWAIGASTLTPQGNEGAYRLANGRWVAVPGDVYPLGDFAVQVAADNAGNGWLITAAIHEDSDSHLIRLRGDAPPRQVSPGIAPPNANATTLLMLRSVAVDGLGRGWAGGHFTLGIKDDPPNQYPLYQPVLLRLVGDTPTAIPAASAPFLRENTASPDKVAVTADGAHAWVATNSYLGGDLSPITRLGEPWPHAQPAAAAPLPGAGRCFAPVPYCLRGVFARYWEKNGGLEQFGYPITPEVVEQQGNQTYTVQYTERARLEYHPENSPPYDVLLGLLGNTLVEGRLNEAPFQAKPASAQAGTQWFAETRHNVGPPLLGYWQGHGGLPVFGLPRSEAFDEINAADGKTYRVQYFERNRIEHHPENQGTRFEFLLGLLGVEQFTRTYGYTP